MLAGFRAEECAVVRATLDALGGHTIKVLPASADMLAGPVGAALSEPEVDWSAPRPPAWILGGAWGSQRTVLFSGACVCGRGCVWVLALWLRCEVTGLSHPLVHLTLSAWHAHQASPSRSRPRCWSCWRRRACLTSV